VKGVGCTSTRSEIRIWNTRSGEYNSLKCFKKEDGIVGVAEMRFGMVSWKEDKSTHDVDVIPWEIPHPYV